MKITRHGEAQQTTGEPPMIGHTLPNFTVQTADKTSLTATDFSGQYTLLSVVPDINTRVCSIQTKHFNQDMDEFMGVNFFTISTNTTDEQQQWCAAEGVKNMQLVSDQAHEFGEALGLFVAANGTDARSVWIIDPTGKIVYRQLIEEQTDEPDYQSAMAYLEAHASR
ncbi:peroxiredoxin [Lacticaseibacillus mingshuiensis]|uniref:Peroxiredoxin n=1 Tax=Lacticaseibacillus mingshuiensis TaxID=2799574 RepID=A0ABW4CG58_9LACO|nr:peroxiredoxin [Lacticaseibacillus mingshuiensis]